MAPRTVAGTSLRANGTGWHLVTEKDHNPGRYGQRVPLQMIGSLRSPTPKRPTLTSSEDLQAYCTARWLEHLEPLIVSRAVWVGVSSAATPCVAWAARYGPIRAPCLSPEPDVAIPVARRCGINVWARMWCFSRVTVAGPSRIYIDLGLGTQCRACRHCEPLRRRSARRRPLPKQETGRVGCRKAQVPGSRVPTRRQKTRSSGDSASDYQSFFW